MRLQEVTPDTVKRAIELFLGEAWGELAASHWPKLDFAQAGTDKIVTQFNDERRKGKMRKYTLRLGNRRYPFMKLSLQESLLRDNFFFAVDTHDEIDIKETTPDYSEWQAIRSYNQKTKSVIEEHWRSSGVPTFDDVLTEIERQPVPAVEIVHAPKRPAVLVVDDDQGIARGVRLILERRGYGVTSASSAEEALGILKHTRPDVILSDYEMGHGLNGLQFAEKVRAMPGPSRIPFILATAAEMELNHAEVTDGFLVKPFETDVLVAFIARHLVGTPRA